MYANLAIVIVSVVQGYGRPMSEVDDLVQVSALTFVLMALFCLGSVLNTLKRLKYPNIQEPSWDRSPLNPARDPLQFIFLMTWLTAGVAIGRIARFLQGPPPGFANDFAMVVSMLLGLLAGRFLVFYFFKDKIQNSIETI